MIQQLITHPRTSHSPRQEVELSLVTFAELSFDFDRKRIKFTKRSWGDEEDEPVRIELANAEPAAKAAPSKPAATTKKATVGSSQKATQSRPTTAVAECATAASLVHLPRIIRL
eukprot:TRINITY_DN47298_c1_g1_i2.p1 TRINITY_DN47298_c1_g1~~TRINITY_DN47298_c1_g1_i2.p1  ORF type:complete len:114 (-),score=20.59 TRINITY_DN47298_c1_g1_i2:172-513(-)